MAKRAVGVGGRREGFFCEGGFRILPLLTQLAHLFCMVVIVRKGVVDCCDFEVKLISDIRRCVSAVTDEFCNIEDANTCLGDSGLTVKGICGLYDCRR